MGAGAIGVRHRRTFVGVRHQNTVSDTNAPTNAPVSALVGGNILMKI